MALPLAEAAKLSNDILLQGVIETIIKDSPVLQRLPFVEITGNGLSYNREATAPSAAFFDVGDTWTESTPTFTQQTVTLKIMGGDADIDNFLSAPGAAPANPKSFDGLDKVVDPAQSLSMGTNGGSLTLDKLDEIIDKVLGGKPDLPLMSRRSRRIVNKLARTPGAFQAGEGGLVGLTAPGGLQIERVGSLETKDARRTRIKWYASLALFNAVKLARLTGVRP